MKNNRILVIAGPTAVGKTEYAIDAARRFNGEIVSCDSMQLYRYMNIGSAKPTVQEQQMAVHHLIDFADPREPFSVAEYQKKAKAAIRDIMDRGRLPVISGGTGLYLNSILYDMDFADAPRNSEFRDFLIKLSDEKGTAALHEMLTEQDSQAAERIHPNNRVKLIRALERLHEGEGSVRPFGGLCTESGDYEPLLVGLTRDREELYDRINRRVDLLIKRGLADEVRSLTAMGLTAEDISMKGIGYKEIIEYLEGKSDLETAADNIRKNTRHYAKRQLTWFRRYDKMKWFNLSEYLNDDIAKEDIAEWLEKNL